MRRDDYGDDPIPDSQFVMRHTLTSVVTSQGEAEAEVARLNALAHKKSSRYFWMYGRMRAPEAGDDGDRKGMAETEVHWTFHVRASTDAAVQKVVGRIAEAIGATLEVRGSERYWKDRAVMTVQAVTTISAPDLANAVFETTRQATAFAYHWTIGRPEDIAGTWQFEGSASADFRVAGLEFASFGL